MKRTVRGGYASRCGWAVLAAYLVLAGMTLPGCGSGGGPADAGQPVDQTGGTVQSANGQAVAEFLPGALDRERLVSISKAGGAPLSADILRSTAYDFRPEGTEFELPVRLSISYDPSQVPAQHAEDDLRLCKLSNGTWTGLADSHVDAGANLVYGHVDSFSSYAVGTLPAARELVVEDTWDWAADWGAVDITLWCDGAQDNWAFVGWADRPLLGIITGMPAEHLHVGSIDAFGTSSRVAFERKGRPAPGGPADAAQHALCWIDPTNCRVGYEVFILRDSEQLGTIEGIEPWGEPGSAPRQFLDPGGMDFSEQGHLFIADTGNQRVQEFDAQGTFVRQYGPQTGAPGVPTMVAPTDVACSARWLWVVDRGGHCLWLYRRGVARTTPEWCLGKRADGSVGIWSPDELTGPPVAGDAPGAFNAPTAICSSTDGSSICVADTGNERVQMLSRAGVVRALTGTDLSVPARSDFTGLDMGGSGRIYVADPASHRVTVLGLR